MGKEHLKRNEAQLIFKVILSWILASCMLGDVVEAQMEQEPPFVLIDSPKKCSTSGSNTSGFTAEEVFPSCREDE